MVGQERIAVRMSDEYSKFDCPSFIAALKESLGEDKLSICASRSGSTILEIQLPTLSANRIMQDAQVAQQNEQSSNLIPNLLSVENQSTGENVQVRSAGSSSTGLIVGAVVGALLFAGIVVVVVVILVRRRRNSSSSHHQSAMTNSYYNSF